MPRIHCVSLTTMLFFALTSRGPADEPAKTEKSEKKPAAKTRQIEAGEIKLNVPESWKQKPSSSKMRVVELEVPPVGDDKDSGEFVVFFFGKQGAGGVQANIDRWVGQVEEEGRKVRIVTGESAGGKYTLVDLSGVYNKSIGGPAAGKSKRLPDWRVISVAIETAGGPYYLKLDGPAKTIAAVETDLRAAFGGNKETEKVQKSE